MAHIIINDFIDRWATRLAASRHKQPRSTGQRVAWFAALYVASILVFGGVLGLLELCLPK
ncbi:MAG: hypothetical protein POH28_04105 [Acidocella sp.]|nr:hypothetical protein [Acidocella sp.]